jgi:ArsR family transcriptional regulator
VTYTTERHPSPSPGDAAGIAATAQVLAVLGDATRLRLLLVLNEGERGVSDLEQLLALPQPTVSHHLGILRRAGLAQARREGRQVFYRLTHPPVGVGRLRSPIGGGDSIVYVAQPAPVPTDAAAADQLTDAA